jgi:hypothetical protein
MCCNQALLFFEFKLEIHSVKFCQCIDANVELHKNQKKNNTGKTHKAQANCVKEHNYMLQ